MAFLTHRARLHPGFIQNTPLPGGLETGCPDPLRPGPSLPPLPSMAQVGLPAAAQARPARSRGPRATISSLSPRLPPLLRGVERLRSPCGEWTFVSPQWGRAEFLPIESPAAQDEEKKQGPGAPRGEGGRKSLCSGPWCLVPSQRRRRGCAQKEPDRPTFGAQEMHSGCGSPVRRWGTTFRNLALWASSLLQGRELASAPRTAYSSAVLEAGHQRLRCAD